MYTYIYIYMYIYIERERESDLPHALGGAGHRDQQSPAGQRKEGQWVLRTPLHIRTLVFLCSACLHWEAPGCRRETFGTPRLRTGYTI